MRYLKSLVVGALLCAFTTFAVAQIGSVVQNQVSGLECWNAGQGPGGPSSGYICTFLIRNGSALKLFSGSGAQTYSATQLDSTLYWVGTAPTTWAITLPTPAFDGEIIQIATDTTLTTLVTVTAGAGQTMNAAFASQTISANTSVEFQFSFGTLKWYRLR